MNAVLTPTPTPVDQLEGGFEGGVEIPGKIEAEKFDYGGPGVAYSDVDSGNNGGVSVHGVSPNTQLTSLLTVVFRTVDGALAYALETSSLSGKLHLLVYAILPSHRYQYERNISGSQRG